MLLRFDPFRDVDRFVEQVASSMRAPRMAPMDVYRVDDHVVAHLDLPGVDPGSVDLSVENNTLTVRATRTTRRAEASQVLVAERMSGEFLRELYLGEGLDPERIAATYDQGVLTVTIPVAERAKQRKISIEVGGGAERNVIQGSSQPSAATKG